MVERDDWQNRYYNRGNEIEKLRAKVEVYDRTQSFIERSFDEKYHAEIERLVEIVRWHIRPETAEIKIPPHHLR